VLVREHDNELAWIGRSGELWVNNIEEIGDLGEILAGRDFVHGTLAGLGPLYFW